MSGAMLPEFRQGMQLTAAALNALGSRIRSLQMRAGQSGQVAQRVRRVVPGRHFAFELAELNGCIWWRQGWLDVGGELVPVGKEEWNFLGPMKPCTVWLNITREGDSATAEVEQGELDLSTPEKNLRRRLGYVRQEEADEYGAKWHAIQLLGGVVSPVAPRRQMGTARPDKPGMFRKSDGASYYMHAGCVTDGGEGEDGGTGQRVVLGYSHDLTMVTLPAERGGDRMALVMGFATNI